MMANPKNLDYLPVGFSLSEALYRIFNEIRSIEIVESCHGGNRSTNRIIVGAFMQLKKSDVVVWQRAHRMR